jgi:hypothetical protein
MKITLLLIVFISLPVLAQWDNPAVLCPEEILPQNISCLDLTRVKNPSIDFPDGITAEEKYDWTHNHAADLDLCRAQELLNRETRRPGSFTPLQVELSWMTVDGGKDVTLKLQSILNASIKHQIPPQVLIGALIQESLLASLGVAPDGGNYSCGIAQLNIQEWCNGIAWVTAADRERLGWPQLGNMGCGDLSPALVAPLYEIALSRLGTRPHYKMTSADFAGITLDQIESKWPVASPEVQNTRFQAVTSFIKNCQEISLSIPFKAQTLKSLFTSFVPTSLKFQQMYSTGQTFNRTCRDPYPTKFYPLHTGWLLAVAAYNAGPKQTQLVEHYFQIANNHFPQLTPLDLIEALHWGGKIKESNRRVYFVGQNGALSSQPWYKSCVVQRHVARVIQHVTEPGKTIARSLEQVACSQGAVPHYRVISSGIKEP